MTKGNTMRNGLHENLTRDDGIQMPSERSLGIVFAVLCALIGAYELLQGGRAATWWLGAGILFLALGLFWTAPLRPMNRLWFRFGLLLYSVISPITSAIVYFLVVAPIGIVMRAMGKDFLRLKRDPDALTYWIEREPPGPPANTMKNQF